MSDTTINAILEAAGELDNTILENAFKPRRKKYIALTVIAAAAALSIVVGFAAANRSGVRFDGGEPMVTFNYYAQPKAHIPTADELSALGTITDERRAIDEYGDGDITLAAGLSDVSELFNAKLLSAPERFDEEGGIWIEISSRGKAARIKYTLADKESRKPISIEAQLFTSGNSTFGADYQAIGGKGEDTFYHYETITLSDGSEAFVGARNSRHGSKYSAVFCLDGIGYKLQSECEDINGMKQILADLGVTAG